MHVSVEIKSIPNRTHSTVRDILPDGFLLPTIAMQFFSKHFVIWEKASNFLPKFLAVVMMLRVRELMNDNVV